MKYYYLLLFFILSLSKTSLGIDIYYVCVSVRMCNDLEEQIFFPLSNFHWYAVAPVYSTFILHSNISNLIKNIGIYLFFQK